MIDATTQRWVERVLAELRPLDAGQPGGFVDRIDRTWRSFAERGRPVVALVGEYNAGKTSLLKRLLVESGEPVPEELTISAQPETFEVHEADAAGCTWVDMPGLATTVALHEERAGEALMRADVYMVVLTPQLSAGDLTPLLTGRLVVPSGWPFPEAAVQLVISRIDEAGVSPSDTAELAERVAAKTAELRKVIGRLAPEMPEPRVHALAADPHGRIRNRPATPELYAGSRDWDGVATFVEAVGSLPRELRRLRSPAVVRYLLARAYPVIEELAIKEATARAEGQAIAGRLDVLERQRRRLSELREATEEDVRAAALAELEQPGGGSDMAERLLARLEGETARANHRLAGLVTEADLQLEVPKVEPPSAPTAIARIAHEDSDLWVAPVAGVSDFTEQAMEVQQAIQAHQELYLGRTLDDARSELEAFRHVDDLDEYFQQGRGFGSVAEVEEAQRLVTAHDVARAAIPVAVEAIRALTQELGYRRSERLAEKRAAKEAAELRKHARLVADQWLNGDPGRETEGWVAVVDRIDEALLEAHEALRERLAGVHRVAAENRTMVSRLSAVLQKAPKPPA